MKKVAFFCIPAHGHTNPMLPVAAELVRRGNTVRFYSFNEFKSKIEATGAEFISCDSYLPELTEKEESGLKSVSTTEMAIQDIRITLAMNDFLRDEFQSFKPDGVYTDSGCFWGKLNAWKYDVPMVVSTSTFAFNQLSSQYMKNSPRELAGLIFGLPKVSRELNKLKAYGFKFKGLFSLIQSDNDTDSVVYTSRRFQPYAESFSDHYAFVGPSVFSKIEPNKEKTRPLVYISLGTVINDRPEFYGKCIEALKDMDVDAIISCGNVIDREALGVLPKNVQVYPYVNQLDILSKADVFITHCGMNSVSESLYMAAPMVLYPQTNEQQAVARRTMEIGAGIMLTDDSAQGIRAAVQSILDNDTYRGSAEKCSKDFRSCSGTNGAAEFIENAPHSSNGIDFIKELSKANGKFQCIYWGIAMAVIILVGIFISWKYVWIVGAPAGILSTPIGKSVQKRQYKSLIEKMNK